MSGRRLMLGAYIALCVAQWVVLAAGPIAKLSKRQVTLRVGEVFRFRTEPVDLFDLLRRRSLTLSLEQDFARVPHGIEVVRGRRVYAPIEVGEDGFARFSPLGLTPPPDGPFIETTAGHPSEKAPGENAVNIELRFNRYSLDERPTPKNERFYTEDEGRGKQTAYISVRVRNGHAVLEELYLDGVSVWDLLAEPN